MPTWTHKKIDTEDEELFAKIFQLGVESQLPAELGCTPIPYPTMTKIRDVAHDPELQFYAIYANNNDLRVAIAFSDDGIIRFCVSKGWIDPRAIAAGAPPHPNGLEQAAYLHELVRTFTGDVKSFNNSEHPAIKEVHRASRVTVIELDESGRPTGQERKPVQ